MSEVEIKINGRPYRMGCEDGQEAHLFGLAQNLDDRVGELVRQVGQIGDARLLVMAALMIADEAHELRQEAEEARRAPVSDRPSAESGVVPGAELPAAHDVERLADAIEALASRLELVAADLEPA